MPSILFICAADRCRSPMASAILRHYLPERSNDDWHIESAGIWGKEGQRAVPEAQQVMEEMGIDLRAHRSRCIDQKMVSSSNLILTMEQDQKEALRVAFPEAAHKIYLLAEMTGQAANIPDPLSTGRTLVDFRATAHELEQYIVRGIGKIVELAMAK